ncbi:uncharacterized protein LOC111484387 isoform X2 [Cucurbita maxima]|uniref:Uncharacterized protein LOC111484387 isoform X2 n=1 Tax=Cucurbita maxima TaxID=3661 RepID=A0A6J1JEU4_CUCMA|nr:uncharacterized protein LOC111484387 isoform X2 [Cucurbita maxima]
MAVPQTLYPSFFLLLNRDEDAVEAHEAAGMVGMWRYFGRMKWDGRRDVGGLLEKWRSCIHHKLRFLKGLIYLFWSLKSANLCILKSYETWRAAASRP